MKTEVIKIEKSASSKWSGGVTTQIYITPSGLTSKDDFNYRISSATVLKGECTFSDFSKYNRFLVILNGEIKISHNDSQYKTLKAFKPYFFDGAAKTKSIAELDIADFNVIYKKDINNLEFNILFDINSFETDKSFFLYNHNDTAVVKTENNKFILKEKEIFIASALEKKYKIQTEGKLIFGNII